MEEEKLKNDYGLMGGERSPQEWDIRNGAIFQSLLLS
jgi:hypothetical protein